MTDEGSKGTAEIESLLEDRQRLQDWLAKLDEADAPVAVRQRVRADYEGRLAEVVVRLRGFSETLTGSLAEHQARLDTLFSLKAEAEEELAEASLRHTVGEYSEEDWSEFSTESQAKLEGLEGEIAENADEIARLEEVLAQIAPPEPEPEAAPEPAPAAPGPAVEPVAEAPEALEVEVIEPEVVELEARATEALDDDAPAPVLDQAAEIADEAPAAPRFRPSPEAPRFTPKPGAEPVRRERSARTLRFPSSAPVAETAAPNVDEMTFIKSVALESPEPVEGRAARAGSKTLKCVECGAMNRPTEWYCEKCGAELAAL